MGTLNNDHCKHYAKGLCLSKKQSDTIGGIIHQPCTSIIADKEALVLDVEINGSR